MGIVDITGLTHSFGDRTLYTNAGLTLYKGDHIGVVGQNGSGKSTLINILTGRIVPSDGHIAWQRGLSVGHMDQYADVDAGHTIESYLRTAYARLYAAEKQMNALYAAMGETPPSDAQMRKAAALQELLQREDFYAVDSHIARVAAGLGLPAIGMERTLATLSGGQRAKVILAKLLLSAPDVLLLDEPTNFLDAEHIQWLKGFLSESLGTFIIVSHDTDFLDAVTTCICDIEFQTLRRYNGAYHEFVKQKAHLRDEYARQYAAQQRQIERLETYIAKNRVRAATARMARGRQKQLDKIERLAPSAVAAKPQLVLPSGALPVSRALEAQGLLVGYDRPLLPPIDLRIAGGEKVAVTGFNGIGKSTLLKTLVGERTPLGGTFAFDAQARIGYFEQDMHWTDGNLTPVEIILRAGPGLLPKQARAMLACCGIRAEHALRPIRTLSGGEQNKVKLCRLTMETHNFLILDEPTNHLDAETKEALRDAIAAFEGCVLIVSHEKTFLRGLVDREISLEGVMRRRGAGR